MPGGDIYCDRELSRDEVLAGLAAAFGIGERDIALIYGMASHEADSATLDEIFNKPSFCFASRWGSGDFFFNIEINTSLGDPAESYLDRSLVGRFCAAVGCRGLTSDDTANPYRWLLADERGELSAVTLDATLLDDGEAPGMSINWDGYDYFGGLTIDRPLEEAAIKSGIGASVGLPAELIAVVFGNVLNSQQINWQPRPQLVVEYVPTANDAGTFWLGLYRRSGYAWHPKARRAALWQAYGREFAARVGCAVIAAADAD
ncbi:MAG TPA: hypothetical protein VD886_14805 [Herpetosiphonaceae bacterium]|nr:hypothetical protein [Herpetosiphonaceae bacterium]